MNIHMDEILKTLQFRYTRKHIRRLMWVVVPIAVAIAVLLFGFHVEYTIRSMFISSVDSPSIGAAEPITITYAGILMDGGSIRIRFVDTAGREFKYYHDPGSGMSDGLSRLHRGWKGDSGSVVLPHLCTEELELRGLLLRWTNNNPPPLPRASWRQRSKEDDYAEAVYLLIERIETE